MNKAFKLDTGNDSLHSIGGIYLAGQVLQQSEIDQEFSSEHKANYTFQDVDIFKSQIGLLIQAVSTTQTLISFEKMKCL
jgi:hypothetical protein